MSTNESITNSQYEKTVKVKDQDYKLEPWNPKIYDDKSIGIFGKKGFSKSSIITDNPVLMQRCIDAGILIDPRRISKCSIKF